MTTFPFEGVDLPSQHHAQDGPPWRLKPEQQSEQETVTGGNFKPLARQSLAVTAVAKIFMRTWLRVGVGVSTSL
jgi:hypothetical protein